MKNLITLILVIFFQKSSYCQSIGLNSNYELSQLKRINNSIGASILIIVEDTSKISVLGSFGFEKSNKTFKSDKFNSYYTRLFTHLSPLYKIYFSKRILINLGPSIGYSHIVASDHGITSNWINSYKLNYLSVGTLLNIRFSNIFNTPISFHIFFNPDYLIKLNSDVSPSGLTTEYNNNLTLLNIQIGLSYFTK